MQTTIIYEKLAQAAVEKKRHIWLEGGTAASKTISVLQLLYVIGLGATKSLLISIVSESIPHIKRGCLRDWQNIVLAEAFDPVRLNKTDLIYDMGKAKVEFFSADDPSKQRGARRHILFLNEANNVPYDAFRELDARTSLLTICDWNPTHEFWYHLNRLGEGSDSAYIHATYEDAKAVVSQRVIDNIIVMGQRDPNWWNIYGLGKLGKIEGLVFPIFNQVKELPHGEIFYGLDFGFSTDVTALVKNVIVGDSLYSQELIYERGLTNNDIADRMLELGVRKHADEIWAESAEPKSIEEIYQRGFNIKGAAKGPGSVSFGRQKLNQFHQFWTEDSLNAIKEQRNYRYLPDKDGKLTEKTTHQYSHICDDARRYAVVGKMELPEPQENIVVYDSMRLVKDIIKI